MAFEIRYSPAAEDHLVELTARQRSTVFDAIEKQLTHQPGVETRNRKLMRPNPIAPWELRIGDLRVYYDFEELPEPLVMIVAIGIKTRSRVRIAGEEIDL